MHLCYPPPPSHLPPPLPLSLLPLPRGLTDATKREHSCWDPKDSDLVANAATYNALSGYRLNDFEAEVHLEDGDAQVFPVYGKSTMYPNAGILSSLKDRQRRRKHTKSLSFTEKMVEGSGAGAGSGSESVHATSFIESITILQLAKLREKAVADSKKILYWAAMHGFSRVRHDTSYHNTSYHNTHYHNTSYHNTHYQRTSYHNTHYHNTPTLTPIHPKCHPTNTHPLTHLLTPLMPPLLTSLHG